jgi:hypothetical protein
MRFFAIILCIGMLALAGCEEPQAQKLVDCTTNSLDFPMTVQYSPPYQFLIGISQSPTGHLSFHGEIVLQQSTGVVARIAFSSQDIISCNWLPGVDGYILTWSRTNHGERLSDLLVRKQTYDVHVAFDDPPPVKSSLWLSSMKR